MLIQEGELHHACWLCLCLGRDADKILGHLFRLRFIHALDLEAALFLPVEIEGVEIPGVILLGELLGKDMTVSWCIILRPLVEEGEHLAVDHGLRDGGEGVVFLRRGKRLELALDRGRRDIGTAEACGNLLAQLIVFRHAAGIEGCKYRMGLCKREAERPSLDAAIEGERDFAFIIRNAEGEIGSFCISCR